TLACPQGHQWEVAEPTPTVPDKPATCPVCGAEPAPANKTPRDKPAGRARLWLLLGLLVLLGGGGWWAYATWQKKPAGPPSLGRFPKAIRSVAISPGGKLLAAGSDDGIIRLWDMDTRKERNQLKGHDRQVFALAFSPDGQALASAG